MILLDDKQTLEAVRRSIEAHVLPAVVDDFARIQVVAAMKAIDDVIDRLGRGDPVARSNARVESGLAGLAGAVREESPAFAAAIDALLAAAAAVGEPRPRAKVLGDGLAGLLQGGGPASNKLFDLLQQESSLTSMEDSAWMCGEAIESLQ